MRYINKAVLLLLLLNYHKRSYAYSLVGGNFHKAGVRF